VEHGGGELLQALECTVSDAGHTLSVPAELGKSQLYSLSGAGGAVAPGRFREKGRCACHQTVMNPAAPG
jgi:hypothetical protein